LKKIHKKRNIDLKKHHKIILEYQEKNKDLLTKTPLYLEYEDLYKKTVELPNIENRE